MHSVEGGSVCESPNCKQPTTEQVQRAQQFTATFQKKRKLPYFFSTFPSSLFIRSPIPTNQMSLQWTVTCFSFRGKMHPRHSRLSSPPLTPLSTCISSQWGGSQGGNYSVIQKWSGEKMPSFFTDHQHHWERGTQSGHLVLVVRIWNSFNFLSRAGGDWGRFIHGGQRRHNCLVMSFLIVMQKKT